MFIRKKIRVECSHQLTIAASKDCMDTIHGHSYIIELFVTAPLNDAGMVIDFASLKPLKDWIMLTYDHALFIHSAAPEEYKRALAKYNRKLRFVAWNPTAENMAQHIFENCEDLLRVTIGIPSPHMAAVRVHETETGYAQFGSLP